MGRFGFKGKAVTRGQRLCNPLRLIKSHDRQRSPALIVHQHVTYDASSTRRGCSSFLFALIERITSVRYEFLPLGRFQNDARCA